MVAENDMLDEREKLKIADSEPLSFDDDLSRPDTPSLIQQHKKKLAIGIAGLIALAAALALALGWFSAPAGPAGGQRNGPPPAIVAVADAARMTMAPQSTLPGTVVSLRDAVIASEASGKVLSVALVGDVVAEGEVQDAALQRVAEHSHRRHDDQQ